MEPYTPPGIIYEERPPSPILELQELGVFDIRNGSIELFFDDEGKIQQAVTRLNKRKREGEEFKVLPVKGGKAIANHHPDGTLLQVTYETTWRRKLDNKV